MTASPLPPGPKAQAAIAYAEAVFAQEQARREPHPERVVRSEADIIDFRHALREREETERFRDEDVEEAWKAYLAVRTS